jgi:hypothetical protein
LLDAFDGLGGRLGSHRPQATEALRR